MIKKRIDMETFLKQVYNNVHSSIITYKELSDEINNHWKKEWKEWIKATADNSAKTP